jgi:hypothetical protein
MKSDAIIGAVQGVTKKWTKQRKAEERERSAALNRRYAMTKRRAVSILDAGYGTMEDAYNKASSNGRLPAHARQIMYAARPYIQRTADRPLGQKFDKYFTQTLLPNYILEYPDMTAGWNVVFDARGNLTEPHTNTKVPLGTLQVRGYLGRVRQHKVYDPDFNIWEKHYPTEGPKNRFGAVLFIEKEGFMPLFEAVKLAERRDIAITSTKGMSVTASRELVEQICAAHEIPLLVLHDFDKAGFSIVGTLRRDTRRYTFRSKFEVVDLGLRLEDVGGLETEDVYFDNAPATRDNLKLNGATEEEIDFLLHRRVELNALASEDLVSWIERKLDEHGIEKVVPDNTERADAYRRMRHQAAVQAKIDELIERMARQTVAAPDDLAEQIHQKLDDDPELSWDAALREIAEHQDGDAP